MYVCLHITFGIYTPVSGGDEIFWTWVMVEFQKPQYIQWTLLHLHQLLTPELQQIILYSESSSTFYTRNHLRILMFCIAESRDFLEMSLEVITTSINWPNIFSGWYFSTWYIRGKNDESERRKMSLYIHDKLSVMWSTGAVSQSTF